MPDTNRDGRHAHGKRTRAAQTPPKRHAMTEDWCVYLIAARKALATAEAAAALGNWPDALAAAHHAQTHTTDLGDAIVRAAFTEAKRDA